MANRLGGTGPVSNTSSQARPTGPYGGSGNVLGSSSSPSLVGAKEETNAETPAGASNPIISSSTMQPSVSSPRREGNASPFPSSGGARAIPAWQMAAAKKSAGTSAGPPEVADAGEGDASGAVA
jgi:hypothetical protein